MTDWNDDAPDIDPHAATEWGLQAVDGSVEPTQAPYQSVQQPGVGQTGQQPVGSQMAHVGRSTGSTVEDGRLFAILSHIGTVLGVPFFLVPLITRDNAFALQHAKAAAVTYFSFIVLAGLVVVAYTCTCGLGLVLLPVVFLPYVPLIAGAIDAANGRRAGALALGDLGERVFSGVSARDDAPPPPQLP